MTAGGTVKYEALVSWSNAVADESGNDAGYSLKAWLVLPAGDPAGMDTHTVRAIAEDAVRSNYEGSRRVGMRGLRITGVDLLAIVGAGPLATYDLEGAS